MDKLKKRKERMARKMFLIKDEHEAIKGYDKRIKPSEGKEKATYKHIKGEEKEHIKELERI